MKIAIIGAWHLGCVTAACLAKAGYDVALYDPDKSIIQQLKQNKAPIFEPGLDELLARAHQDNKISYSYTPAMIEDADIVWVTFDTPVDDQDHADVGFVMNEVKKIFSHLKEKTLVIMSSQLLVGITRQLASDCATHFPNKKISFACIPENLRLGKAIDIFTNPDRIVVGLQQTDDKNRIATLLKPFTENIIWMSLESAEMTKHAINAFLATSVTFINELASICERVGADANDVELGLKSEERIGVKAYLRPGNAIAGGTLARDIHYLIHMSQQKALASPLFHSVLESNQVHQQWSYQRLLNVMNDLSGKIIATLGLTYKPGTNTLRRSNAVETCQWLNKQGATVVAYDPVITQLPEHLSPIIDLKNTMEQAILNADAIIIGTKWPEFMLLTANQVVSLSKQPLVFDVSGFLRKHLGMDERISYYSLGCQP